MIAGLSDAYLQASSTKMIADQFDSVLEIGTYKPSTLWFVQSKQNFVWENGQVVAALAGLNFQVQI